MARGPRTIEGIKRAVLYQREVWRKNRYLAQARANVSGFGSMVGVFFAVAFACFSFISYQPWYIFGGLAIGSLVFSWRAILSAERHLGSVPIEWKLTPVFPFSERITHKVAALPVLPETSRLMVDRTLAKFAQLALATRLSVSPPVRAALDDVLKIAEDALSATLWDSSRIENMLKTARARPKDLGVQMAARSMRHRFQLPSLCIEAVTADLIAAVSSGGAPDVNAITAVGRDLAERLRAPPQSANEIKEKKARETAAAAAAAAEEAAEAQEIEALESGAEHRTLSGRVSETAPPAASSTAAPAPKAAPTAAAATAAAANAAATGV